jgi:broad specificity phosphatase PhoE
MNMAVAPVTANAAPPPFCRCKDTAQLAFDRSAVNGDLYFALGTDARETTRFSESLRRMLSTAPATATNAVVVSHTANLREAIAMVLPEDWDRIAHLRSPGKSR